MFERSPAPGWQERVPGASWFKADLHVHTIDDHPGGKARLPVGASGPPDDPAVQDAYARLFLQHLVASGIQVAGLTPHSPRAGAGPDSSALWRIVEEWNSGVDDDGGFFREKIYALFPGFEIKVNDGRKGVHLLVLFDPEIGRERHLSLFDAVMDGKVPWHRGSLQTTRKSAGDVLRTLDGFVRDSQAEQRAEFLVLGAHFLGAHGVNSEMGSQVRETFPLDRLAGLGLPQSKVACDFDLDKKPGRYWLPLMKRHRQAFFHGSDAYRLEDVGRRHTWIKLASPRIRALRQAFVASDSRLRDGFERDACGSLVLVPDPSAAHASRPWLRSVTVKGRASFFGEGGGTKFAFSPDLTCVIGGSMTGKSTLLDGLRLHTEAPLPQRKSVQEQVTARGENFRTGSAVVSMDCPGSDPTAPPSDAWSARFFAQNELQQLAQDAGAVEDILARLYGAETSRIENCRARLAAHDAFLSGLASSLNQLDEQIAEVDQAETRALSARKALETLEEVGIEEYHRLSTAHQNWRNAVREAADLSRKVGEVASTADAFSLPDLDEAAFAAAPDGGADASEELGPAALRAGWLGLRGLLDRSQRDARRWVEDARRLSERIGASRNAARTRIEQEMAARGRDSGELKQFHELSRRAALLPSFRRHAGELRADWNEKAAVFSARLTERVELVREQRKAFDRVIEGVATRQRTQGSRIRARRVDDGDLTRLTGFLESFKQRGITRWWREADAVRPTPAQLLARLENDDLGALGMSLAVQRTFRETMTAARKRELAALRCRDLYVLELEVAAAVYRPLAELSGGQRVSLLLTLLLETSDDRPLVIDQPEDELDSRFLLETVLPALKKLKGQRQMIVATHDANIVVNGDADLVIQLEATADRGRIACAGAIDDPEVRDAIVRTVDGGREAFRLRRQKYGF